MSPEVAAHADSPDREPLLDGGAPGRQPALRFREVTKRFGDTVANDGIGFAVDRGEIVGLLGENGAGKTTLMRIACGLLHPDEGGVEVGGQEVQIQGPQHAAQLGIGMVHQHFMLVPSMSAAENVALTRSTLPGHARVEEVGERLQALGRQFSLEVDAWVPVDTLSTGERQRIEILKVLYRDAEILILDEPTSALGPSEWAQFAQFLKRMAGSGKAVIFITHKLDELFGLVDRCVVIRDGRQVADLPIGETDKHGLATVMVGREVNLRAERPHVRKGRPMLEVEDLEVEVEFGCSLREVTLSVAAGEVLGVAGVAGNGQKELVEAITGVLSPDAGTVAIGGASVLADAQAYIDGGGSVIPEQRHRDGVAEDLSVAENLLAKELSHGGYSRWGLMQKGKIRAHAQKLIDAYEIRGARPGSSVRGLSGGNQQKVVLARELSREPKLIVAFQPTHGLDVGAMETVYRRLNEAKTRGAAILLVSYELDEIQSLSDRVAVMVRGRIVGTVTAEEATPSRLGLLIGGEEGPP